MNKIIVIFLMSVGLVYSDFNSNDLWHGYIAPTVLLSSLLYLFWFKTFFILTIAVMAFYNMNIESTSIFESVILSLFFISSASYFIALSLPIILGSFGIDYLSIGDSESGGCDGGGAD